MFQSEPVRYDMLNDWLSNIFSISKLLPVGDPGVRPGTLYHSFILDLYLTAVSLTCHTLSPGIYNADRTGGKNLRAIIAAIVFTRRSVAPPNITYTRVIQTQVNYSAIAHLV